MDATMSGIDNAPASPRTVLMKRRAPDDDYVKLASTVPVAKRARVRGGAARNVRWWERRVCRTTKDTCAYCVAERISGSCGRCDRMACARCVRVCGCCELVFCKACVRADLSRDEVCIDCEQR